MTNLNTWAKTSPFQVVDNEAFVKALEELTFDDLHVELENDHFVLYGDSFYVGRKEFDEEGEFTDDNGNEMEEEEVEIVPIIQQHLKDDQVVMIIEVGREGYRYVGGLGTILTKDKAVDLHLEDALKQLAIKSDVISKETASSLHITA